ncbi:MAG: acyl-CoA carboxylase subunit epsilon [Actinophytocola sp.]|uniref:acyl-CoA carboxylase subunit epsilon n=1 Tax=Actinophytocola sp. TaxID=1872138 RepID=UPI003D6B8B8E
MSDECLEGVLHDAERPEGVLTGGPFLRVERGEPDDAEVAALAAVAAVLAAAGGDRVEPDRRSRWSDRGALLRAPLRHGPGAWRASAF